MNIPNLRFKSPALDLLKPMSLDEAMSLAIHEAYKGGGYVSPNPHVGCVILDEKNRFLSSGYHEKFGEAHAEVNAVQKLTLQQLEGAHVIVTLEPCAHEGKTPSCAKMLAGLPIKKVTYGLRDPNPLVSGQGAEILKSAGKDAALFETADLSLMTELEKVCEVFLRNFREKEIFVALKLAQSLDGHMHLGNRESKWLTNEKSREEVHVLRSLYDVTAVGVETFLTDDPALNVRHPHIQKENRVLILDPKGRGLSQLKSHRLLQHHSSENIFWCVSEEFSKTLDHGNHITLLKVPMKQDGFDLDNLHKQLWCAGVRSMMVEGGPGTLSMYLKKAQRIHLFQAPLILGHQGQKSWAGASFHTDMSQALQIEIDEQHFFDGDTYLSGRIPKV